MSDTKERKLVDVSALIAGDVQFVQIHVWTEAKGLHMVKLRVVEEVAANLEPMANEVTGASWHEMSCCGYVIEGMEPGVVYVGAPFNYCPGCGNKIKP